MPATKKRQVLTKVRRWQYRNPIHLARQWKKALASGQYDSPARLAYHLGISRARVIQILNLLRLSPEVLEMVSALGDPLLTPVITECSLRPLLVLSAEQQLQRVTVTLENTTVSTS